MTGKISDLSRYSREDVEKSRMINDVLMDSFDVAPVLCCKPEFSREISMDKVPGLEDDYEKLDFNEIEMDICSDVEIHDKYCPECGRGYPSDEDVCMDCLVRLRSSSGRLDVRDIESDPQFALDGENDFKSIEELLGDENLALIDGFDFSADDYSGILRDIRFKGFENFVMLIKENKIDFDSLSILEKVTLFAKSFVKVGYKSSGEQLGYFELDRIVVDDRQTWSLQITTLIHELSHFILQEIITRILCRLLDASRNSVMQEFAAYILSCTAFAQLVDEYAAHNVEGRFTVFGFQDYSSFLQIEKNLEGEMTREEIEITKSIGNTFAISIREIFEALIDRELRDEIKEQFLDDVTERPNYKALKMENCQILTDEGFIKAIWLILDQGFKTASLDINELKQ